MFDTNTTNHTAATTADQARHLEDLQDKALDKVVSGALFSCKAFNVECVVLDIVRKVTSLNPVVIVAYKVGELEFKVEATIPDGTKREKVDAVRKILMEDLAKQLVVASTLDLEIKLHQIKE